MKFKDYLQEDKSLDTLINKIDAATDRNDTYEAWIIITKYILKNKKLADAFEGLYKVHHLHRYLTPGLAAARKELTDMGIKVLKRKLSQEDLNKVLTVL